jgi:tetratricopeptide (TPR) repeat protein
MKHWFLIILLLFSTCSFLHGQSPERPRKEVPLLSDVVAKLTKAEGWMLQNNGEWTNAKNKIPFRNYAHNKVKGGRYSLGEENFDHIDIRSITIQDVVYSVMLIYSQKGEYEFPLLEEKWSQYEAVDYYAFEESKWNSIFHDSIIFNQPYAINTEIICSGSIDNYNEDSYLFEIENQIRQAIYQQNKSNSNLIFAVYPVKIKSEKYVRFKFYETINKREIYIKYLLPYNWEKIFRNFYYEVSFDRFEEFVENINAIAPTKTGNPEYYLHFIKAGIAKYENQEYRTALQNFIKATMVNPPDSSRIRILLWKGKSKFQLKSFGEALVDFDSIIQREPTTISEKTDWLRAFYERGNTNHALHNYAAACKDWNFALMNGIDEAYRKIKKKCDKSSDDLLAPIDIEKSERLFDRAMKKFNKGQHLKALHLFESAWNYNYLSRDFRLPYYIGVCRYNLGDYVRSIDEFDLAIAFKPESFTHEHNDWSRAYLMNGNAWHKTGYVEEACKNWKRAVESGNTEALELLETFCEDIDLEPEIVTPVQEASPEAAISYYNEGDFDKAITALTLSKDTNDIVLLSYLGNARHKTGDYTGAVADFTKIISMEAEKNTPYYKVWVNAHFNRGTSKYFKGDINGACLDWQKAIDLGLNAPFALKYTSTYCRP